jgi:hypothetical protein
MKTSIFTAITLAAIFCMSTFFTCHPEPKPPLNFNIAGEWRVDSIYTPYRINDSMQHEIDLRLVNEKKKRFLFYPDSSFIKESSTDSSSGKYYMRYGYLCLDDSKGAYPYHLQIMSDSMFSFVYKDNMIFILKRE